MKINDYSLQQLRQLDAEALTQIGLESLSVLTEKLISDLAEARERLNQNSQNSSRPPGSEAPWEKSRADVKKKGGKEAVAKDEAAQEEKVTEGEDIGNEPGEEVPAGPAIEGAVEAASGNGESGKRKAGKVVGSPGYGREAPTQVDKTERHEPESCACCGQSLQEREGTSYTGHYEVDLEGESSSGWRVVHRLHKWYEKTCQCGHKTRAEAVRYKEKNVEIGGCRLVGAGLATLIVALSTHYRMSRVRIQGFLEEWLNVRLSVGTIHEVIEEVAAIVAPIEEELIAEIGKSELLHADETPWPEQGSSESLWFWVFLSSGFVLYFVSSRGKELVKNVLGDFEGILMSDGWQAYRWYANRIRCWAHLKRKAVGLSESYEAGAKAFGLSVLNLWEALREAVIKAREGPPESLQPAFAARLAAFRAECKKMKGCSHQKTGELAREFLNDWDAIFAVLNDPRLPLTNNAAERALRPWVILRRITYGTRTPRGSHGLALLASVTETCRMRKHSPWVYLRQSILLRRQNKPLPPLPQQVGG
jgi:hypothetical protein